MTSEATCATCKDESYYRSHLVMYTDGGCSKNGTEAAVGGMGVYIENCPVLSISEPLLTSTASPTNQRAELGAMILALKFAFGWMSHMDECCVILIYTDSMYVKKGLEEWSATWQQNGWKNNKGQPVANQDQWQDAVWYYNDLRQVSFANLEIVKVKGHSGSAGNDAADQLATRAIKKASNM